MFWRIWNLAVKEFIQLIRDRLMTAFIFLFPVAQLVLLAQATGKGITDLPMAVLDLDRSASSRELIRTLDNVPDLTWRYQPDSQRELEALIEEGRAVVGIVIPASFGDALTKGSVEDRPPAIQVIVDGSNNIAGNTAKVAVESTVGDYVRRLSASRGWPATVPIQLLTTARYNPSLNSRLFTIPAQLGFIVYQVTLAVASLAFARERELGTLEGLLVTPFRRLELISGKAMLAWLIGGLDFFLMYWIVVRVFQVPMRGSFGLLIGLTMLFIAVEIGFGVTLSSFARTQQQAILYVFLLAMLDIALSGYLVPVKNMPVVVRTLAQFSPLQHYLVMIRGVMLKGAGLAVLRPHVEALCAIGVGMGVVALRTATRNLE